VVPSVAAVANNATKMAIISLRANPLAVTPLRACPQSPVLLHHDCADFTKPAGALL